MTVFVGVDGGGTHTRAVIVDGQGRELGRAQRRGAVVRVDAPEVAAKAVGDAVRAAAAQVGVALPATTLWAGLAGAGTVDARAAVVRELEAAGLAERVVVGTDVEAAFHDAFGDGPGILLIAGTGSIACARGDSGTVVRVGGWGDRIGDEGSGFAIGSAALRAVVWAEDGRGQRTLLHARVLRHVGVDAAEGLVSWVATADKGDVAALVPLVVAASREGDEVATAIVDGAVSDLCEHVRAAAERAGPWPATPELVLCGGLLQPEGSLRPAMERAVSTLPVLLRARDVDPALGAARLASAPSEGA